MKKNYTGEILNFLTNCLDNNEVKFQINLLYEMDDSHLKWSFVFESMKYHFHVWKIDIQVNGLLMSIYKELSDGTLSMPIDDKDIRKLYKSLQEQYARI